MNNPISIFDPTECATHLMVAMANTQALAMKTAGAFWNVWGVDSNLVRGALGMHRELLTKSVDELAARLSFLNVVAPSSPASISAICSLADFTGYRDRLVVRTLRDDHRVAARELRETLEDCTDDMGSSALLANMAAKHDALAAQLDQILCMCGSQVVAV